MRNKPDMLTTPDPHHGGDCTWGYDPASESLYHRCISQSKWTRVRRIGFTPKRVLAIASLITLAEQKERTP